MSALVKIAKYVAQYCQGVPSNCKNAHTMTPVPGTVSMEQNSIGVFLLPSQSISFISYFLTSAAFLGDVRIVQP